MTTRQVVHLHGAPACPPPEDRVFEDPADVVSSPDLTPGQKLRVLATWEGSLRELLTACGHDPLNSSPGHLGFMYAGVTQGLAALRRAGN